METQTQNESKPTWKAIDPTTLGSGLFRETVVIDPKADAFAITPPLPDGKYIALIGPSTDPQTPVLQGITYPAREGKPAVNVIRVNAVLTVEGFFNSQQSNDLLKGKSKDFDKSFSTGVKVKEGLPTTEVSTLLQYLGVQVPATSTNEELAFTLKQVLDSKQARIGIEVVWKAGFVKGEGKDARGYDNRGKWTVIGMRNFDLMPGGVPGVGPYNPVKNIDGQEYRAKAYVTDRLFSLIAKG